MSTAVVEMNVCQGVLDGYMSKQGVGLGERMSSGWDDIKGRLAQARESMAQHAPNLSGQGPITLSDWLSGGAGAATGIAADVALRGRSARKSFERGEWPKPRSPIASLLRYMASGTAGAAAGVGLNRGSRDLMLAYDRMKKSQAAERQTAAQAVPGYAAHMKSQQALVPPPSEYAGPASELMNYDASGPAGGNDLLEQDQNAAGAAQMARIEKQRAAREALLKIGPLPDNRPSLQTNEIADL